MLADFLLETMLKKLNLLAATYKSNAAPYDEFDTIVMFYPSARFLQASLPSHSLDRYPQQSGQSLEESVNVATRRVIKYIETEEKKVLKDYSYIELQGVKKNKRLQYQLERKDAKLVKTNRELTDALLTCDIYTNNVSDMSKDICKIVTEKLVHRELIDALQSNYKIAIADIQNTRNGLDHHTEEAIRSLKATGAYPLDFDCTESSSYYGIDDDFDSDGHRIDSDYDD